MDFEYLALNAQAQVLTNLVANAPSDSGVWPRQTIPNPAYFTLSIGNDQIDGQGGDDLLIGDNAAILAPVITGGAATHGGEDVSKISKRLLRQVTAALGKEERIRDAELAVHLKRDHIGPDANGLKKRFPKPEALRRIGPDYEFIMSIGNDVIRGGANNDIIIGDTAAIYVPTILSTVDNTARTPKSLEDEIERLTKALDTSLSGRYSAGRYPFNDRNVFEKNSSVGVQGRGGLSRVTQITSHSDTLAGEDGNDFIAGDHAALSMPFTARESGSQVGAFAAKFDVQALIRDFGHALPGQEITKPVAAYTTHIDALPSLKIRGSNGKDTATGGQGDDVLLGSRADTVSDTQGTNYVEGDYAQRSSIRFDDGADAVLGASIRKYLASLAADPLGIRITEGEGGKLKRQ
jgi:Ca2+-binding RTX toxin-like protein